MNNTERQQLPSREQLLGIIHTQSEIAKLGLDLGSVMQLVVIHALQLVRADGAVIELAEEGEMVYRAASGIAASQLELRLSVNTSLSGLCVRTGEVQRCDDAELDSRADQAACRKVGLRSMLVVPLQYRDTTVGVLKVLSRQPHAFGDVDEAVLGMLAELLGADMYFAAKYAADELFYRATHDQMTNLANRALFMDRLRTALLQTEREGAPVAVLMIDMDGLKAINDTFGHRAGDAAICELAERLRKAVRSTDSVARLGGDEFAVILQPVEGYAAITASLHRLHEEISPAFHFEQQQLPLTASIGAALAPDDGCNLEDLLEKADQAMYQSKRQHKGRATPA